ncbi:MAG: hypothetical protein JRH20_23105 [Deltaproteobacteria bacterium]|nr:hypothetical protein [Deltaproteobacteria bacterium]
MIDTFKNFLSEFSGTQRELLAALEASWLTRILAQGPSERAIVAALIRKKVKSKKLVAERDAFVEKVFD